MASAKAGVHVVQLKQIAVGDVLCKGYKFIKWDDESMLGTPVTLKVDPNGFFLYWTDQNSESEFLEISSIRDVRTGRSAKLPPREGKLKDSVSMGPDSISLEDKTMTIVYGSDFVNVNFVNFCCNNKDTTLEWTNCILAMAYNLLSINASPYTFMTKCYTRLNLLCDCKGNIAVKNVAKMFTSSKEDKKRVDKALEAVGLPSGKNDLMASNTFTLQVFNSFRGLLAPRNEIENIFNSLVDGMGNCSCDFNQCQGNSRPSSWCDRKQNNRHGHSHSHSHGHQQKHYSSSVSSVVSSIGSSILNKHHASSKSSSNNSGPRLMSIEQLVSFLNKEQRDPRRNEILYPYVDRSKGQEIINCFEPSAVYRGKSLLSLEGFTNYLMSEECTIVDYEKIDLNADMDQPLNHYFINSSHNTYLSGHQLTGKSSVEMYRQALLAGCRCIELDCWNGRNSDEEPIITHGFTVVTEIVLKDVLEAIADAAFKTCDFPVILSFENHCSPRQQAKIAFYCRKIFGDMLLTEPLPGHPLKPGVPLPSPRQLMRKIIIKNKKKHHVRRACKVRSPVNAGATDGQGGPSTPTTITSTASGAGGTSGTSGMSGTSGTSSTSSTSFVAAAYAATAVTSLASATSSSSSSTPEKHSNIRHQHHQQVSNLKNLRWSSVESTGSALASIERQETRQFNESLEDVCQGRVKSQLASSIINRGITSTTSGPIMTPGTSCDIEDVDSESSGDDDEAITSGVTSEIISSTSGVATSGDDISTTSTVTSIGMEANVYLKETQPGAEMSALVLYIQPVRFHSFEYAENLGMQLNLGIFEYNGRCGYLLKPDFMRRADRLKFDPFTESTVDGIIAGTVSVQVISGQFLTDKKTGTYVEVDMFGLPADTVRRKRTKTIANNGLNPIYNEEAFQFKKVVLPELACLRFAAYEESGKFIGHRVVPVTGLRPGYRHVTLRNESGQPLMLPSLFVHITVKDYVPDEFSDIADALANPIAYQSMSEKRGKQLEVYSTDTAHEVTYRREDVALSSPSTESNDRGRDEPTYKTMGKSASALEPQHSTPTDLVPAETGVGLTAGSASSQITRVISRPSQVRAGTTMVPLAGAGAASAFKAPLVRQETFSMSKITKCLRSLSDESAFESFGNVRASNSLLESDQAKLTPESLDKLKQNKSVLKLAVKMEKEMSSLEKKHEKAKERQVNAMKNKECKILKQQAAFESKLFDHKNASSTPLITSGSESASTSTWSVVDKRESNKRNTSADLASAIREQQNKLDDLYKASEEELSHLMKDQISTEMAIFEKHHEAYYDALKRAMSISQGTQMTCLQSLHDQEVTSLMKRLESQNKEDLNTLGKKHKDKYELARIKRELQQRLIDTAVAERQRASVLLEKRQCELQTKFEEEKKRLQEEKERMASIKRREYETRLSRIPDEIEKMHPSHVASLASSTAIGSRSNSETQMINDDV